jgi:glycosyltransferase involved in cell wall biosynthesis
LDPNAVSAKELRILHTETSKSWGGQEIRVLEESSNFRARGHEVRIAAPADALIVEAAKRYGIPVHPIPIDRRSLRSLRALAGLFAEFKPDVVVTHSSTDSWLVALASRISSARPAIVRLRHHSRPVAGGPLNRWLYGRVARRVVTTGEAIRLMLIEKLNLDPNAVVSIPTGTDISRFFPGDRAEARARLGLAGTGPIIGIVATLRSGKGHRFLILAMTDPRLASARLVIVGDGPQLANLREQVAAAGLTDRVIFTGNQNDVAPWMRAFDLFVLPSTGNEGVPQALAQAMASGLPVVTTPVGAIPELVQDGKTGLIVPPGNAAALADAIARLLGDDALVRRLAAAGRKHVAARFTTTAMLDAMEKVLHQAAHRD